MTDRQPPLFDLEHGRRLKAEGQERVALNGELFQQLMRTEAKRICALRGSVTADDLRQVAEQMGIEPHHPNAWGAIFRGKEWQPIGTLRSRYVTNHARLIQRWTLRED